MKFNKYDVENFFYLVSHNQIDNNKQAKGVTAYQIAKYWENVGNDDEFKKSLDCMVKNGEAKIINNRYVLVATGVLANPQIKDNLTMAIKNNMPLFREVLSKSKKYTFWEWILKVDELREKLTAQGLVDGITLLAVANFFKKK